MFGSHVPELTFLCIGASLLTQVVGQLAPPFGGDAGHCNLSKLPQRIAELNEVCCIAPSTTEKKNQCDIEPCDAQCVGVLLPLLDECQPLLNEIYDGADGKEDGNNTQSDLAPACNPSMSHRTTNGPMHQPTINVWHDLYMAT